MSRILAVVILLGALFFSSPVHASIVWSLPGPVIAHENGAGADILGGAVKRGPKDGGVLYFKFKVDPLTDVSKEEYFAAFMLYDNDTEHLGVGNSFKAWAYSAFNTENTGENNRVYGDIDLHSATPESYVPGTFLAYELPRRGIVKTIIFKVQFIPNGTDLVTAWVNPDLNVGASEDNQQLTLTTHFKANCKFNQIRIRHHGDGDGWKFSDMEIATSFDDFIVPELWQRWWFIYAVGTAFLILVGVTVLLVEKRKYRLRLLRAEQGRALEHERSRIAQDLHDDLGSSLSRISLLSGLVREDKNNPAQVEIHAAKLVESADQTIRALDEIVWAVRSGGDTLQSLVDYISHFATGLFEKTGTRCRLNLPSDLPACVLAPDLRHNIFLIAKEALTNALKHANGNLVQVEIAVAGRQLNLIITDDGKGFSSTAEADSKSNNGMGNMLRRAEAIGGNLSVTSEPGKGTRLELKVNLPV
jgi:two-component sensor histidine kinase